MSGSTPELNLGTAVDSDDTADYLTLTLANSLRTIDALFNNVSGHRHNGSHQGGPIDYSGAASIPGSAIMDGAITSSKIADGTIAGADLASPLVLGNGQYIFVQGNGIAVQGGQGEAKLKLGVITVPAGETAGVFTAAQPIGLLVVNVNGGGTVLLLVHGGTNDVTIVSDPKNLWSIGTVAGKTELFFSAGNWWLRNNTGASAAYYAEGLGL